MSSTTMNYERVTMGLQGLGGSELAYQNAALYANDRSNTRTERKARTWRAPALHAGGQRFDPARLH